MEGVASQLHDREKSVDARPRRRIFVPSQSPVARDLQTRFFAVILALISVAAMVFAWINFQKEREFFSPYDGVWWMESGSHLQAQRVDPEGPGERAGIKLGDTLLAVDG